MKKKIIPFLFSMFLLTSCGDAECTTHDYGDWSTTTEATCTTAGVKERTCKTCGNKETGVVEKKEHTPATDAAVAATCSTPGKTEGSHCSVCNEVITPQTDVDATGAHTFVDATDQTGAVEATCNRVGKVITECSSCHTKSEREVAKLETHTFGDWTETAAATHSAKGSRERTCSVCNKKETEEIEKLAAHTFGETAQSVEGDIVVVDYDVYTCETDNVRKLVWNANDVTDSTKIDKYNDEDNYKVNGDGVKFGGRPIGNAASLPASSANPVFDATVPGAFVEYKIDLATSMVGAQLCADMQPAQWLDSKGGLFMSANAGSDWTPGLVADETSESGYKITDFRFVIEVNGKAVTLDPSMNVSANDARNRGWYDLPCKVNLKSGENTIKIIQAGGWEPTFYSFGIVSSTGIENPIPTAPEGFEVGIVGDEHVTGLTVFQDKLCSYVDTNEKHYSRSPAGRKLNDGEGQVNFAIEVEEGYKVKDIELLSAVPEGVDAAYKNFKFPVETSKECPRDDVYRITKVACDISVKVITESVDVVKTGFNVTFVKGEHIQSIEIHSKGEFDESDLVEGLVAVTVDKNTKEPSTDAANAQAYIKVIFEEGYCFDSATYEGEKPFKNAKEDPEGSGLIKFTQVSRDCTITITAKAVVAA